jgi:hypothetical protein
MARAGEPVAGVHGAGEVFGLVEDGCAAWAAGELIVAATCNFAAGGQPQVGALQGVGSDRTRSEPTAAAPTERGDRHVTAARARPRTGGTLTDERA